MREEMGSVARATAEAARACGKMCCQRQCVHVDAHYDDSFEITS